MDLKNKMEEILVSIIVPVYNIAPYVEACLMSIREQTWGNLEIIVVDDGSTDGSSELCDAAAADDARIKVIHQKNTGLMGARNTGIEVSSGEYLSFVDGDDWIEPDMVEELMKKIEGADVVTAGIYRQFTPYQTVERYDKFPEDCYSGDTQLAVIFGRMIYDRNTEEMQSLIPSRCNKLYRNRLVKQVYKEVEPDITYGEDAVFLYRYLLRCRSIVICHKCFYHYRYREESIIHAPNMHMLIDINKVYLSLEKVFRSHPMGEDLLYQLQRWTAFVSCKAVSEHMGFDSRIRIPEFMADLSGLKDKKLIVYGAGSMGKDTYFQLKYFGYPVVLWADRDYKFYQDKGLPVVSPNEIIGREYDLLMIAVNDKVLAEKIKEELKKKGILEDRIIWKKPLRVY